jgi:hypothetical protein
MVLLYRLVGERKQHGRHFEIERLGGLEVDRELELGSDHRQVGRLRTTKKAGVDASLSISVMDMGVQSV